MIVEFPIAPTDVGYLVLDTDYKTFTSVYACYEGILGTTEYGWILTRDKKPSKETV